MFGPFWTVLDRLDHFDHLGPFWPVWTILDRFGPFWTVWTILDRMDHFGPCSPKINFRRVPFFGTPCRMYYSSGNFLQQGCELLHWCLCPLQGLLSVHQPVSSTTNRSNRLIINRFLNSGAPCWPVTRLCR